MQQLSHSVSPPPQTLGRATEVNSFVKQGTKDGYIEIALKGPKGKNLVIRRLLKADHKTSTFTLNGINATGKEISNQMAALNVQVGNLWYFLFYIACHNPDWIPPAPFSHKTRFLDSQA